MRVKFWGVRGSVAVSGGEFLRTGGNTTCVEVEHAGERLVLDGGTGLQALGRSLGSPVDATVLFTHVHWDHIQGVPFFAPAYHPGSRITFVGAPGLRDALAAQMRPPLFPITLDAFRAQLAFWETAPEAPIEIGPFRVESLQMPHPDGVVCYRISAGGRTVVFATDVEHGDALDPRLVRFAEGADLLLHDAQYTTPEYRGQQGPCRKGWGHSTWEQALETGRLAGASRLALIHHDPTRTDDGVGAIEVDAQDRWSGVFAAREGVAVTL
jgi:phosphoribosyl 1,2-cyclic phosphodiesterase